MKTLKLIAATYLLATLFSSCNKNEYAPEIVDQEFSVDENSPAGTVIGQLVAFDLDEGQVPVFEIIDGNDEGICTVEPDGSLKVADPANLDFESIRYFDFTVLVSDGHKREPLESYATVGINILDVNEFPPSVESQEFTIDENPNQGAEIGVVIASDQESHQSLYFHIVESENSEYFSMDSISGMLSVLDSAGFDYESNQSLTITVSVRDDHENALSALAEIIIQIEDLPEEKHLTLHLRPDAPSGKDARIGAIVPDNNYGTSEELFAYAWTQDGILNVTRTLMDFDLSVIPADARIDSAFLSLYFNPGSAYASQHSGETDFTIQRLISSWEESTVTWSTQPTATYANYVTMPGAVAPYQDFPDMNITALIQDYIDDPAGSHGFLLKFVDESPYKILVWASSDHPLESLRPKLDVYYAVPE